MADRVFTLKRWLAAAVTTAVAGSAVQAQDRPDLTLRYRELTERDALKFSMKSPVDAKAAPTTTTKPVGWMNWEFPDSITSTMGFDPNLKAFCIEPLIPVTPGMEYGFNIDTFGKPRDFAGVAENKDGDAIAKKRTAFVRELYGRYYDDLVKDPAAVAPAFQTALWELVAESDMQDGPMPFSLYTGGFQVAYQNEKDAPLYVKSAQGYLQSLTGDDSSFTSNPELAGMELVRLSGTKGANGVVSQAQLVLRQRGGVSTANSPFSTAPVMTGGGLGGGGLGGALSALGARGPVGGGGGFGGGGSTGGGGGFFGGGGGTTVTDSSNPSTPNPIVPVPPTPPTPPTPPVPPVPPVNPPVPPTPPVPPVPPGPPVPPVPPGPPVPPPPPVPPVSPPPPVVVPPPDPNPVPAPPAAVLGLIAAGLFAVRKLTKKTQNTDEAAS
jgi:hypothetical protein